MPPYEEKNAQLIELILKELQLNRAFGIKYGFLNENLYNYAMASLLYNMNYADVVEKWEFNDLRFKILQRVEQQLR